MLDRLVPNHGAKHRRKRVGRGPGSSGGQTAGRGEKGQGSRSGGRKRPHYFEGGQVPLVRRLPKRGFHNIHRKVVEVVNLSDLSRFGDGAMVDPTSLIECGLVRGDSSCIKLLGNGQAPKNLSVKVHRISEGARGKLEGAGGSVELIV